MTERILKKINKTDTCWIWEACKSPLGYGFVWFNGRTTNAHRAVYELLVGEIPKGMQLDHLCKNPSCVNPEHLEIVTPRVNTLRSNNPASINAKKIYCLRGHNLSDSYIDKYGRRNCRKCHQIRKRAFNQRQKVLVV